MEGNNFKFKENEYIHCLTEYEANQVLQIAHDNGYRWCDGESFIHQGIWEEYEANTCYDIAGGVYGDFGLIKSRGYTIIKAEEFLKQQTFESHKPFLVW